MSRRGVEDKQEEEEEQKHQEVEALNVAVHDADGVEVGDRLCHVTHHSDTPIPRHFRAPRIMQNVKSKYIQEEKGQGITRIEVKGKGVTNCPWRRTP